MTEKFLDKEIENFEITENHELELQAEKLNTRVRCWVGTWNNPKMTDEEFCNLLKSLEEKELLQYAIFQRELGEKSKIEHFQFFLNFKNKQYFTKLKRDYLPYGCHFAPMRSDATRCKQYCSKVDTRVSGPYEIGEFEEERARTDLLRAIKMIDEGIPYETVAQIFPSQSVMYANKLKSRELDVYSEKFKTNCRDVEIIFIYGPPRTGKTTFVNAQANFDFNNIFVVENYGEYMFTGYQKQKYVVFDEFAGQVPITKMNKLLEPFPMRLNVKGGIAQASFDKIYIVSNYSLKELYQTAKVEQYESYKAFCERINKIIRFDKYGQHHLERDCIWEDIPKEEQQIPGLTKRVVEKFEIDSIGKKRILYSRYHPESIELIPLDSSNTLDSSNVDIPWL